MYSTILALIQNRQDIYIVVACIKHDIAKCAAVRKVEINQIMNSQHISRITANLWDC